MARFNVNNYGGFPFVPALNPFNTNNDLTRIGSHGLSQDSQLGSQVPGQVHAGLRFAAPFADPAYTPEGFRSQPSTGLCTPSWQWSCSSV